MLWALLCGMAISGEVALDRPLIPGAGIATEDGPGTLWINPANLAYDPDVRFGLYIPVDISRPQAQAAISGGIGSFSAGVQHRVDGESALWALDAAAGIPLPKRIALGARFGWHIRENAQNYVTWDAGASWRPAPWLGISGIARNIGSNTDIAIPETGAGVALRPFGPTLTLGGEYLHSFIGEKRDRFRGTLRVRPAPGFYVRLEADSTASFGGGIEFYFGGVGVGTSAIGNLDKQTDVIAFIGTGEPGESLTGVGRRVPVVKVNELPYQPTRSMFEPAQTSWLQLLEKLDRAEMDRGTKGVAILLDGSSISWAQRQELRERILRLEAAGKRCLAYLHNNASMGDYYIASAASRVLMHPSQDLVLTGFSAELTYFRGTLDLLGIEPQFVRQGMYKSAVESWTNSEPSPPSLEQTNALLDDFEAQFVSSIAASRSHNPEEVRGWLDGGPWSPREAIEHGMIDGLLYPDQLDEELDRLHQQKVRAFPIDRWPTPISGWRLPTSIAIVHIEGPITAGPSSDGGLFSGLSTGSESIRRMLEEVRQDPAVRAVVLRIDSPGGSAFASDEIHRAVIQTREAGKPVVVSMGGVAASGGYYIASAANSIWAEPTTVTGSIGVFSGKFALNGLLDRIGVGSTLLTRGRNAAIDSTYRRWDAVQTARMQTLVDSSYLDFKRKVAVGRNLTLDQVETVAQGRVWSGQRAKELGLVDELGGLLEAVDDARQLAHIPPSRDVDLIAYTSNGRMIDALLPVSKLIPNIRWMGPYLPHPSFPRPRLAESFTPFMIWSQEPEGPWMMDPWLMDLNAR